MSGSDQQHKIPFYLLDEDQLVEILKARGFEKYRAEQIFEWVYKNRCSDPSRWTNLPKTLRDILREEFAFDLLDSLIRLKKYIKKLKK